VLCEVGFEAFGKFAPRKQYTPPASFAFEPDIRAETRDRPFVGAARMLFAETQVIVETEIREHFSPRLRKSFDVNIIN